jgi:hypothetical protein
MIKEWHSQAAFSGAARSPQGWHPSLLAADSSLATGAHLIVDDLIMVTTMMGAGGVAAQMAEVLTFFSFVLDRVTSSLSNVEWTARTLTAGVGLGSGVRALANLQCFWDSKLATRAERPLIGDGPASGECPVSEMGIASRLPLIRSRAHGFFLDCETDHQNDLRALPGRLITLIYDI